MKYFLILGILLFSNLTFGQKYFTKTGSTVFKATADALEPVEAENESTTVILNTTNGELAALLFIKAFDFEIALMQEHFNENYMESDKFPKATFKGQLMGFDTKKLSAEFTEFKLKGTITIRGKEKSIDTVAKLKKLDDKIVFTSRLTVEPEAFNIQIPGVIRSKIAKSIHLILNYELTKKI